MSAVALKRPAVARTRRLSFCGQMERPGIAHENLFEIDYSTHETSVDQQRIEDVLRGLPLARATLLHVGIGNSSLARRLADRVDWIDGVTVHANEKALADTLGLPNYRAYLINKYGGDLLGLHGPYDYIIDNNLASFACCSYHFERMLTGYAALLDPGGRVMTDQRGMAWTADGNDAWKLTYKDLVALEEAFPLRALRITDTVYALERLA